MSLLPEETQQIVVKSYKGTTITRSESTAENIYEEKGSETATDFASECANENQRESSSSKEWAISNTVTGQYPPYVKGTLDTDYNSQSSTRKLSKTMQSVSQSLATKLTAKRNVTIEAQRDATTETEEHSEISTTRTYTNPNKGHTLTLNWFQLLREYREQIHLESVELLYSSGFYPPMALFMTANAEDVELPASYGAWPHVTRQLPEDLRRLLPPNAAVIVVAEPYSERIPMAQATSFLGRVLNPGAAFETASRVWNALGFGEMAPDGLGVLAFSRDSRHPERQPQGAATVWTSLFDGGSFTSDDASHSEHVPTDEVKLFDRFNNQIGSLRLPNLDLRYRDDGTLAGARYTATTDPLDTLAVPRLLAEDSRVISTNGVLCDAMLGECPALEPYLERCRDLDLLEKRASVAGQELELLRELAKDSAYLAEWTPESVVTSLISADSGSFGRQRDIASAASAEEVDLHSAQLRRRRLESEIAELDARIAAMAAPSRYEIDVPDGADVELHANVGLPPPSIGQTMQVAVEESDGD